MAAGIWTDKSKKAEIGGGEGSREQERPNRIGTSWAVYQGSLLEAPSAESFYHGIGSEPSGSQSNKLRDLSR